MPNGLFRAVALLFALTLTLAPGFGQDAVRSAPRPAIYDPGADMKLSLESALKTAKAEGRMVLLMFGANWCPWCHKLHTLLKTDPAIVDLLGKRYTLLMVDVGETKEKLLNREWVERYGIRSFGIPALVVLDADGKTVATQSTGVLEAKGAHDPVKVLQFLQIQLPTTTPAAP